MTKLRPYKPGKYGKGMIASEASPKPTLWRIRGGWNGSPHHSDVADALGITRPQIAFHVDKQRRYYFHQEDPGSQHVKHPARLAAAMKATMPGLSWGGMSAEEHERRDGYREGKPQTLAMSGRPLRDFERGAHLHVLDWSHQTARYRFGAAGAVQVKAAAKAVSRETNMSHPPELPALEAALHGELRKLYAVGHATVRSELDHQATGEPLPIGLSATALAPVELAAGDARNDPGRLRARARVAAADVAHLIWQAISRARLQGITSPKRLRRIGREAGAAGLRQAASHHAGGAINAGRHAGATIHTASGTQQVLGARYTSVLDKNSCAECVAADDGVLRALDDPALIHPPNPACAGGDRCRCLLVYQLRTEVSTAPPDDRPIAQVGVGSS